MQGAIQNKNPPSESGGTKRTPRQKAIERAFSDAVPTTVNNAFAFVGCVFATQQLIPHIFDISNCPKQVGVTRWTILMDTTMHIYPIYADRNRNGPREPLMTQCMRN